MGMSDREHVIINNYEKDPRFLQPEFLDTIKWKDIPNHPIDDKFLPVLVYFRDVEMFTDVYYQQLLRTPTGRDPLIRRFMDRWWDEERLHGDLLDRFLNEAGFPTGEKWYERARREIPRGYRATSFASNMMANLIGKRFSAVHMTWGAMQELSTLQGYKHLWETAKHPVLEQLLRGIAREESSHIFFYHSIAKIKLAESRYGQRLARYLVDKLWTPVGQGTKPATHTNYVIQTLFGHEGGLDAITRNVNGALNRLPGFETSTVVTDRISAALQGPTEVKLPSLA